MKFISAVISLIISSVPVYSSKAVPAFGTPYLTTGIVGPFATNKDTTFDITAHNLLRGWNLKISYAYAHNGSVYADESYQSDAISIDPNDKTHSYYTFQGLVMPLKGYLSTNGVKITFKLTDRATVKATKTVTIYPRKAYSFDGSKYHSATSFYEVSNQIFQLKDKDTTISKERYSCYGVFANTYNHKKNYLVLQNGSIYCDIGYPTTNVNTNKYLVIDDKNNLFPYMNKSGTKISLQLTCSVSGNNLAYKLSNTMYVNQHTLQMSSTKRSGFVSTSKFYLPLYNVEKMESYSIYLSLASVGYSLVAITFPLSFVSDYQLFGSCNSSTYCIGGGVN